ncbi:hypothetical protein Clacol_005810 [Clathrus columnatus]|uniref:Uncharacterized protein n=1 Tax=Clathrus columnatus TaxID=1419009 RepID=A0AAV5AI00_9AGAM|nr:hypothetical protein Clacol_005810 [Clathrus columnatus]
MTGSRKRYVLDLDDIMAFPDANNTPVFPPKEGESWYIITEIIQEKMQKGAL